MITPFERVKGRPSQIRNYLKQKIGSKSPLLIRSLKATLINSFIHRRSEHLLFFMIYRSLPLSFSRINSSFPPYHRALFWPGHNHPIWPSYQSDKPLHVEGREDVMWWDRQLSKTIEWNDSDDLKNSSAKYLESIFSIGDRRKFPSLLPYPPPPPSFPSLLCRIWSNHVQLCTGEREEVKPRQQIVIEGIDNEEYFDPKESFWRCSCKLQPISDNRHNKCIYLSGQLDRNSLLTGQTFLGNCWCKSLTCIQQQFLFSISNNSVFTPGVPSSLHSSFWYTSLLFTVGPLPVISFHLSPYHTLPSLPSPLLIRRNYYSHTVVCRLSENGKYVRFTWKWMGLFPP